ncbi:hypothetical protein EV177_008284 [Coemansia sp. RSA 1804]|nr:hypothetical protein EV177_008284 [Coemansia sp. RSA 1804]
MGEPLAPGRSEITGTELLRPSESPPCWLGVGSRVREEYEVEDADADANANADADAETGVGGTARLQSACL